MFTGDTPDISYILHYYKGIFIELLIFYCNKFHVVMTDTSYVEIEVVIFAGAPVDILNFFMALFYLSLIQW